MSKKIWRYTMNTKEQKLWETDGMQGWCEAMEACVEDEARDAGSKKYLIFDRKGNIVAKGDVSTLVFPEAVAP